MSLESDLFKRKWPLFAQLEKYGFVKEQDEYIYTQPLSDGMTAEVHIHTDGKVTGRVVDTFTNEEYVAVHTSTPKGSYAAKVRSEYLQALEVIASQCFKDVPFSSPQMNRISFDLEKKWKVRPSHPFKRDKDSIVYCHENSRKWFALMQEIVYEKLNDTKTGTVEILTLKKGLHYHENESGIYPGWHMNHDHWITIAMDDTVEDQRVLQLLEDSYHETENHPDQNRREGHWIIPANPEYFDVDHAFSQSDVIYWKQSTHINPGDLVFMYYGAPYSQLRYLCEVVETNIPYNDPYSGPVKINQMMRIRKLYFFDNNLLGRKLLAEEGVKYVRGPLHIPLKLEETVMKLYPETGEFIEKRRING